ncbi:MAG: hypothetical protein DRJ05_01995 [Bacteroidetes bacterium]|nr:MAG: hypothetical protein DRJ05_01995 [Bacteroidota bacterium]
MTIDSYFSRTEQIIADFDIVVRQKSEKIKTDDNFGVFKGSLYFEYGRLEFIEVIKIVSNIPIKTKYKYHYLADNNVMIFRYDNVKHHPQVVTYPHHKHIPDEIIPCDEPNFLVILTEIKEHQKPDKKYN